MSVNEEIASTREPQALRASRVTFDQLRTFVAIVDSGGFHRAAAVLHRSQSAVTQKLKQLEDILGQPLLNRDQAHALSTTEAGRRFLQSARDVLHRVDVAVQSAQQSELCGQVRLGVSADSLNKTIPALILKTSQSHPELDIRISTGRSAHLLHDFERQMLDVVIFKLLERSPSPITATILNTEPLVWVANKPIHLDTLDVVPLVMFHEGCVYRTAALDALGLLFRQWKIICMAGEYDNNRVAIAEGLGIGVLPRSAVAPNHVILDERQGFPALPRVQLAVAVGNNPDPLFVKVLHLLEQAWHTKQPDAATPSLASVPRLAAAPTPNAQPNVLVLKHA